jgi:hypothetical protein
VLWLWSCRLRAWLLGGASRVYQGRGGGRGGGSNRLGAWASNPCYLCVAAGLSVSEAHTLGPAPAALPQPGLRGRGDDAEGPVPPCRASHSLRPGAVQLCSVFFGWWGGQPRGCAFENRLYFDFRSAARCPWNCVTGRRSEITSHQTRPRLSPPPPRRPRLLLLLRQPLLRPVARVAAAHPSP